MTKVSISEAWEKLFESHRILEVIEEKGYYEIEADTIKKYKEPRLMTKFDTTDNLPKILKINKLGILPIENGKYYIAKMNLYNRIDKSEGNVLTKEFPSYLQTLDLNNIYSESNALNIAFITGMIDDVAGEKVQLTISGRMRVGELSFGVDASNDETEKVSITVKGTQIEIDGGYEGENHVLLIEAKNRKCQNFIIRQLFYPYKFWLSKVNKNVVPVFMEYDNGLFNFFTYEFTDKNNYSSIKLVKTHTFRVMTEDSEAKKSRIIEDVHLIDDKPQFEVPFPQADSFNRIIEMIYYFNNRRLSACDVSDYFQFTRRQGNYYISAAIYLELLEKCENAGLYKLSDKALFLINNSEKSGLEVIFQQIMSHKVFNEVYRRMIKNEDEVTDAEIIQIMREFVPELTDRIEVLKRRSRTVRAWINWSRGVIFE